MEARHATCRLYSQRNHDISLSLSINPKCPEKERKYTQSIQESWKSFEKNTYMRKRLRGVETASIHNFPETRGQAIQTLSRKRQFTYKHPGQGRHHVDSLSACFLRSVNLGRPSAPVAGV